MIDRLVVLNDRSAAIGGASALALFNARLAASAGLRVTYLCGDAGPVGGALDGDIEVMASGCEPISPENPQAGLARGLWNTATREAISRWITRHDTQRTVYHLHGWSKILSPSVFAALRPVAHRLVVHAHDFFLACPNGAFVDYATLQPCALRGGSLACLATNCDQRSGLHKAWRFLRHHAREIALSLARHHVPVVMIHERMREFFGRGGGLLDEQLLTLPNPVSPFRHDRVEAERNRCFYFVGRVVPEKGVAEFLAAAAAAGVAARVIGDGGQLDRLRQAHPGVEFLGWRSKEEIAALIGEARALVVPTKYPEVFGLVAIEAMGSGVPVVISDQAFVAPEITRAGAGCSVDVRDADALADVLGRLARDDDAVRHMSERGRADWQRCCTTPQDWFESLHALYRQRVTT